MLALLLETLNPGHVDTLACRLHNPWSQLQELADSFDLNAVDDVTHRHIPYGENVDLCASLLHQLHTAVL